MESSYDSFLFTFPLRCHRSVLSGAWIRPGVHTIRARLPCLLSFFFTSSRFLNSATLHITPIPASSLTLPTNRHRDSCAHRLQGSFRLGNPPSFNLFYDTYFSTSYIDRLRCSPTWLCSVIDSPLAKGKKMKILKFPHPATKSHSSSTVSSGNIGRQKNLTKAFQPRSQWRRTVLEPSQPLAFHTSFPPASPWMRRTW